MYLCCQWYYTFIIAIMHISKLSVPYISPQDPGTPLSIPGMLPPINTNRMPPTGLGGTGSSPLASPVTTPSGQLSPSLAGGNYCTCSYFCWQKICHLLPLAKILSLQFLSCAKDCMGNNIMALVKFFTQILTYTVVGKIFIQQKFSCLY